MAKKKPPSKPPSANKPVQINFPPINTPPELRLPFISVIEDQILVLPQFFSSETCKEYIVSFSTLPLLPSPPAGRNEATRTNHRLAIEDPQFAKRLYTSTGLESFVKDWTVKLGKRVLGPKGLHSNIRIYRYDTGAGFGPHYDSRTRDPVTGFTSYWTLLVYLTGKEDGVDGGETIFYEGNKKEAGNEIVVGLDRGAALLHRHGGNDCLLHEGSVVKKGVKWVLRSDLVFG